MFFINFSSFWDLRKGVQKCQKVSKSWQIGVKSVKNRLLEGQKVTFRVKKWQIVSKSVKSGVRTRKSDKWGVMTPEKCQNGHFRREKWPAQRPYWTQVENRHFRGPKVSKSDPPEGSLFGGPKYLANDRFCDSFFIQKRSLLGSKSVTFRVPTGEGSKTPSGGHFSGPEPRFWHFSRSDPRFWHFFGFGPPIWHFLTWKSQFFHFLTSKCHFPECLNYYR